jgi:ribulose-5-phosphate 4-epimerase/fuculose-1-phosphate aldolase
MSVFSEESLKLRRELAYACRILAANGQNDTVYGHVTYREAGAKTFWMKPSAMVLDEITMLATSVIRFIPICTY